MAPAGEELEGPWDSSDLMDEAAESRRRARPRDGALERGPGRVCSSSRNECPLWPHMTNVHAMERYTLQSLYLKMSDCLGFILVAFARLHSCIKNHVPPWTCVPCPRDFTGTCAFRPSDCEAWTL